MTSAPRACAKPGMAGICHRSTDGTSAIANRLLCDVPASAGPSSCRSRRGRAGVPSLDCPQRRAQRLLKSTPTDETDRCAEQSPLEVLPLANDDDVHLGLS